MNGHGVHEGVGGDFKGPREAKNRSDAHKAHGEGHEGQTGQQGQEKRGGKNVLQGQIGVPVGKAAQHRLAEDTRHAAQRHQQADLSVIEAAVLKQ
ncbi:hypothetical protein SDC9_161744 [bioreactor metagenome]|uniref:Uncharacterized protein n=1 Tax=bioreactor metagenome TaxID=1076179 RepID=A0A645FJ62_9ZZZZ